ncbi:hypothetical protein [Halorarum halobium]|uniref:hypothetical protein n=1 Tax=Halorarum halobium TaxID=3075121 RepID=UPI0028AF65C2|nr:hypothetical protein [Halobaculum sp. XH14]
MYEERLGTDWETLSEAEAIDRAFALGVASAFGYENDGEFERLRDVLDSSYDRSLIELAYREGTQKALALQGKVPAKDDVWRRLVTEGEGAVARLSADESGVPHPATERGPAGELPSNLARADLLEGGEDLEALQYPRFLGRRSDGDDGDRGE